MAKKYMYNFETKRYDKLDKPPSYYFPTEPWWEKVFRFIVELIFGKNV